MEQTANYGQSGRNFECGDLGLEVDGSGVDAAIAVDRSREGSASLIGGEGGVLNKEELARHGVDGLDAVEEGELVALEKRCIVVDDRLRELADGGVGVDGEGTQANAAHKNVGGVLGHADAGEAATRDLIRCEDGAAIESDGLGDIDLDHVDVGLDEGIEDGHLGRQILVATAQHAVELLVDGGEVAPLGATVHLSCAASRDGGLDGQLTDDGTRAGLAVEKLAYLTTDFSVCSKNFSHCLFLSVLKGLTFG